MKPIHRNAFPAYLEAKGFNGTIVEVGVAEGKYAQQLLAVWPFKYRWAACNATADGFSSSRCDVCRWIARHGLHRR